VIYINQARVTNLYCQTWLIQQVEMRDTALEHF
jgi:hypothetical protein